MMLQPRWEEDENGGRLVFTANGEKYYNNVAEFSGG